MTDTFADTLARFETALDARPLDYETLIGVFRAIELPASPDADELTRLFACCYRILDFEKTGFNARLYQDAGEWYAGHLEACAFDQIECVMYDRNAQSRAWIAERIRWHEENDREVPDDYLSNDLPPALTIPWGKETARARTAPLLEYWQNALADVPTAHFSMAWKVTHDGYPVFCEIVEDWMHDLDEQGLGVPGTWAAFAKADELLDLADREAPLPWADCERNLLPLLKDPHPMIVAGAARVLGAFYAEEALPDGAQAPSPKDMLEMLGDLETHRAIACGGFVCGFDTDCAGLHALKSDGRLINAGFVLDDWILHVITRDDYEPYLPNAQALWFYIHEHYCADPKMVMTFIDKDRSWLAMMCATEVHEAVDGMKPVLERLATDADPQVADMADQHLETHYD